jgi:hypothetical protein
MHTERVGEEVGGGEGLYCLPSCHSYTSLGCGVTKRSRKGGDGMLGCPYVNTGLNELCGLYVYCVLYIIVNNLSKIAYINVISQNILGNTSFSLKIFEKYK